MTTSVEFDHAMGDQVRVDFSTVPATVSGVKMDEGGQSFCIRYQTSEVDKLGDPIIHETWVRAALVRPVE